MDRITLVLDVIHQLALVSPLAAYKFFKADVVQDGSNRAIHVRPDRLKVTGALLAAVVVEATRFETRELDEWPAHASNDIAYRDLTRRPRQHIAAFHASFAPHNVDALQDLHDLEKELDRNSPALRN